jgi:hypothetical protein
MAYPMNLSRVLQLFAVLYVLIALSFTSCSLVSSLCNGVVAFLWASGLAARSLDPFSASDAGLGMLEDLDLGMEKHYVDWNASRPYSNDTDLPLAVRMEEDLFLSKAFSTSLHPSKIIPYYYRATSQFDKDDITVITLITSNRLPVFARMVRQYQGQYRWVNQQALTHSFQRSCLRRHSCW